MVPLTEKITWIGVNVKIRALQVEHLKSEFPFWRGIHVCGRHLHHRLVLGHILQDGGEVDGLGKFRGIVIDVKEFQEHMGPRQQRFRPHVPGIYRQPIMGDRLTVQHRRCTNHPCGHTGGSEGLFSFSTYHFNTVNVKLCLLWSVTTITTTDSLQERGTYVEDLRYFASTLGVMSCWQILNKCDGYLKLLLKKYNGQSVVRCMPLNHVLKELISTFKIIQYFDNDLPVSSSMAKSPSPEPSWMWYLTTPSFPR